MRIVLAALLLAGVAAPAAAEEAVKPATEAAKSKADAFDLAKVMAMFEKIFPAGPEPAPARLALARSTAGAMLPNGTYAALFDEMMSGMVERVMSLTAADIGVEPKGTETSATTLRQHIARDDPHFEERMRIMRRVIGEELLKLSAVMEPSLREGLARSIARRLDDKQLTEVNAFLATDSGKAFAGQSMRMWVDPDVMRSMVQAFPHMITAMPGAMARLKAETAHLPEPKKKKAEVTEDEPAG